MITDSNKGTDLQIQNCGKFSEDNTFSAIRDKYQEKNASQSVVPALPCGIVDPDLQQILAAKEIDGIFFSNDKLEVVVDVRGFNPENVRCNITGEVIEISASQHSQEDESKMSQKSMTRKYQVRDMDPENSICNLSSDGFLYITVPWNKE
ncbi:hypothetical protein Trydic_g16009 [Trypoxylus dichotomus]